MIPTKTIQAEIAALLAATPNATLLGIGIDIETTRSIQPEAARFFLNDRERGWLARERDYGSQATLLRLWTVKEAIFKADPADAERLLGDYTIEDPSQWRGIAYGRDRASLRFQYSSVQLDVGFVSIAILVKGECDA
jgi:4'-phosphopantetheinyl transferase EntD